MNINWQTPAFGEPASESTSLEKLRRWTQKLSVNSEIIEITETEDDSFVAIVGELGVFLKLFDDLLWIVMPLGEAFEGDFELTIEQLAVWLALSTEINYAYVSLQEGELSVAYEMSVSGSSYEAFQLGFVAVLDGARQVLETGEVRSAKDDYSTKPPVEKKI